MNANRRKQIIEIINKIETIYDDLQDISELIEDIRTDEEDAYDNLPESLQESERGESMQEAIDNLQGAIDEIDLIRFDDITTYLEDAQA